MRIPPEMEVSDSGARRAGETDVGRRGDSRVLLEDGGGVQLVTAADDVVAVICICRVLLDKA